MYSQVPLQPVKLVSVKFSLWYVQLFLNVWGKM